MKIDALEELKIQHMNVYYIKRLGGHHAVSGFSKTERASLSLIEAISYLT